MEKELLEEQVLATVTYYRFQVNVFLTICVRLRLLSSILTQACNARICREIAVLLVLARRLTQRAVDAFGQPGMTPHLLCATIAQRITQSPPPERNPSIRQ